jgi:glycyl-tRNA synthetase
MEQSGADLRYIDPENNEKFIPHVIEPTFGINRIFLALMAEGFSEDEEDSRLVLKLSKNVSPYIASVFPLVKNKPELVDKAQSIYSGLRRNYSVSFDSRGNIGKRYLAQDEIGTPYCITVDYQTLEDDTVTIRDRDSKTQERIKVSEITNYLSK